MPSTAPRPPGRRGIIPAREAKINTSPITTGLTLAPNAKNTKYTLSISNIQITKDNGSA